MAVAVKLALVEPMGMVTDAGTVTALLLLARATVVADVAAAVRPTVQASDPAPVSEAAVQESAVRVGVGGACPVPLRLTVAVVALLVMVIDPVKEPAVVGSNVTVRAADCPWGRLMGKLPLETAKPVPDAATLLMVRVALPEEVMVSAFGVGVLRFTEPNESLAGLTVMAGDDEPAGETFTWKDLVTPP